MKKESEKEKCMCGEQTTFGGADVEIGGICHKVKNPCYVLPKPEVEQVTECDCGQPCNPRLSGGHTWKCKSVLTVSEVGQKEEGEELLSQLLKRLDENVFVKSTNSVTDEEEILNPVVEDMEATIAISGEWDREDLKGILLGLLSKSRQSLIRRVEELKKRHGIVYDGFSAEANLGVYNQAIDDIIRILSEK